MTDKAKIVQDKDNAFLKRREVKLIAEADKNPSLQEAYKILAELFKASEENIALKAIKGKFGRKTFLISANIYKSKEEREKIEPKLKKKEQAGQAQPSEKKVEEKK